MLTSPERVQMTTLVSVRLSDLGSPNDEVRIIVRCLRMSLDLPSLDDEGETKVVLFERH